jgi:hypothetical protein
MMHHPSPDTDAAGTARAFTTALAAGWQSQLGASLLNVTLLGSLAHGGFSRRYSDIDIAIVTESGLNAAELDQLRAIAVATSEEFARKLSIFWTDRTFAVGRLPPLDRVDFLDHGVTLIGQERVTPDRPSLDEIRDYLCGKPFESWTKSADQFATLDVLEPKSHKSYLRAHLYPARFIFSFMTGRMGSNDDAVEWLQDHVIPGLDVPLIAAALDCRRAGADPDALFPARTTLPRQIAACTALVRESEAERP